ncbi:MAG: HD domain-containing protein [Actinomycetota bacterium]|nr:HD domain-containing protein [Actinomycetota bacterium]
MKADASTRVLLIGADASLWIGLSSTMGGASRIFVPNAVDADSISSAAANVDVIVVVLGSEGPDCLQPLHLIGHLGLQRRTVVLAQPEDQTAAAEAALLGIAGYLQQGSSPEQLAAAVQQVTEQGVMYDAWGAAELHSRLELTDHREAANIGAAKALAAALELKDTYTGGHAERVTAMAMRLARVAMLEGALPSEVLEAAFLLHDVGKIGIPESILSKPGGLTDTERRVLQTHPILGERVVAPLGFPCCVRDVIRHHHERWDGKGYPDGLAGTAIPAAARLFSIADVLDAMTSMRPYRKPVSFHNAIREIKANAGTQFDPHLCALVDETFLARDEIAAPAAG